MWKVLFPAQFKFENALLSKVPDQFVNTAPETGLTTASIQGAGSDFLLLLAGQPAGIDTWGIIIATLVSLVAGSVVYICYHAVHQWTGRWRPLAIAPLFLLAVWIGFILVGKMIDTTSHQLWAFEILAWSMLTSVYLATLMTAKRIFDKADHPQD